MLYCVSALVDHTLRANVGSSSLLTPQPLEDEGTNPFETSGSVNTATLCNTPEDQNFLPNAVCSFIPFYRLLLILSSHLHISQFSQVLP
jgi:hypothetical protein